MTITFRHYGKFERMEKFLNGLNKSVIQAILEKYGQEGVSALSAATPKDTGFTSQSWGYKITANKDRYNLIWTNSNESEGIPIVVLIQYGHGTASGAFVEGRDFINPAIRPILDRIAEELSKEVTKL